MTHRIPYHENLVITPEFAPIYEADIVADGRRLADSILRTNGFTSEHVARTVERLLVVIEAQQHMIISQEQALEAQSKEVLQAKVDVAEAVQQIEAANQELADQIEQNAAAYKAYNIAMSQQMHDYNAMQE